MGIAEHPPRRPPWGYQSVAGYPTPAKTPVLPLFLFMCALFTERPELSMFSRSTPDLCAHRTTLYRVWEFSPSWLPRALPEGKTITVWRHFRRAPSAPVYNEPPPTRKIFGVLRASPTWNWGNQDVSINGWTAIEVGANFLFFCPPSWFAKCRLFFFLLAGNRPTPHATWTDCRPSTPLRPCPCYLDLQPQPGRMALQKPRNGGLRESCLWKANRFPLPLPLPPR